jgi:hypothetical protein
MEQTLYKLKFPHWRQEAVYAVKEEKTADFTGKSKEYIVLVDTTAKRLQGYNMEDHWHEFWVEKQEFANKLEQI